MPRTKVAKSTAKRVREGEDACDLVIKNFETRVNFIYQDIEYKYNEQYAKLDEELETFRNAIPVEILDMRLSDLKRMAFPTFADVKKYLDAEKNLNSTVHLDMSIRDEGYLTEASTTSSHHAVKRTKKSGVLGPLDSARARSRRSRSAGQLQTPSVLNSIRAKKPVSTMKPTVPPPSARHPPSHSLDDSVTSSASTATTGRASRAKFRTPSGRTKAASADRVGMITPKFQIGTPTAILRYARMGETLVSASGSPVAGLPSISDQANIAIPIGDGVLSVRPTSMGEFDRNLLHRIDPSTLSQLRKLQDNLNMVIRNMDQANL